MGCDPHEPTGAHWPMVVTWAYEHPAAVPYGLMVWGVGVGVGVGCTYRSLGLSWRPSELHCGRCELGALIADAVLEAKRVACRNCRMCRVIKSELVDASSGSLETERS